MILDVTAPRGPTVKPIAMSVITSCVAYTRPVCSGWGRSVDMSARDRLVPALLGTPADQWLVYG